MFGDLLYTISKVIKSRIFIVSVVIIAMFGILIYRIFDLQIVKQDYYLDSYVQQSEKTIYTSATRGNIYDRNGELLAYDTLAYSVVIQDEIESSDTKNAQLNKIVYETIKIIEKYGDSVSVDFPIYLSDGKWKLNFSSDSAKALFLTNIFGDDTVVDGKDYSQASAIELMQYLVDEFFQLEGDFSKKMTLKIISVRYNLYLNSYQKYVTTTIATDVSEKTMTAIEENQSLLTGVSIETQNVRKYNYSEYFAPIIGYTGTISDSQLEELNADGGDYISSDVVGKAGIESSMETYLQGTRGETVVLTDSTGSVMSIVSETDAQAGNDVYLTIDYKLQIAAYNLLEKKIASILVSEIVNYDVDEDSASDEDIIYISVKKVYAQLVRNNVVSISHLKKQTSDNEAKVYSEYKSAKKAAYKKVKSQLNSSTGIAYNDMSDEYQEYYDYIYDLLKDDGILLTSSIDTDDDTYNSYIDGDTSLNEFLIHAIKQNWISLENLGSSDSYLSTDETYDAIVDHILDDLDENNGFGKLVMAYRIYDGTINGAEICMLLYDQGVLKMDEEQYSALQAYNSVTTYNFIIKQIKKLNITPAQIALDPCSGSVVVTDPDTGKVLALVTYPSYDNNMLSGTVDYDYWVNLTEDLSDPLYNRATQGLTAPGSTFKICTAITSLENGVVSTSETVTDEGEFEKVTPSPTCWIYPTSTHGSITISQAIAQSCNYFFYEMGYRLGTTGSSYDSSYGLSLMEEYATQLGLNQLSGVEITESDPNFSTESAVHSAIGQGSHAYAPVQLARYVSTIANGGSNYSLTLLKKVTSSDGELIYKNKANLENTVDISDSTWDTIHSGMRMVVTEGTVKNYFTDTDIAIAGKSGTAQESTKRNSHSLFIAYAPYSDPEITVTAVIPFGNSSHDSAELAKNVIQYYYGEIDDDDIDDLKISADSSSAIHD